METECMDIIRTYCMWWLEWTLVCWLIYFERFELGNYLMFWILVKVNNAMVLNILFILKGITSRIFEKIL